MPPVFIQIDRPAAAVRGLWRLLAAVLLGGFVAFAVRRIDWEEYWRDQRLVGVCWAFVLAIVALPALGLCLSGIRWLVAAASAQNGVELNDQQLVIRAGAFGNFTFDWRRLRLVLDGDLSPEAWAEMPEDAIGIALFHPQVAGDIFTRIRALLGDRTPEFVRALRERLALLAA